MIDAANNDEDGGAALNGVDAETPTYDNVTHLQRYGRLRVERHSAPLIFFYRYAFPANKNLTRHARRSRLVRQAFARTCPTYRATGYQRKLVERIVYVEPPCCIEVA